jgi:hypothetical protein
VGPSEAAGSLLIGLIAGCEFGPGGQQELLILNEHFKRTLVVIAVLWELPFALLLLVWLFNVL